MGPGAEWGAAEIDVRAQEYRELEAKAEAAAKELADLRKQIIAQVLEFGTVPPRATKTKVMVGQADELRVSKPTEVTVDTKIALRIRNACKRSRGWNLFDKLFRRVETFTLAGDSQKVLANLPPSAPRGLRALYAQAVHVKDLTPSLEVRRREKKDEAAA